MSAADAEGLAAHLGLNAEDVKTTYLNRDPDGFSLKCRNPVLTDAECVFLGSASDSSRPGAPIPACTVYEARPEVCRTWPFWQRLFDDAEHYAECQAYCGMLAGASHEAFRAEFLRRER